MERRRCTPLQRMHLAYKQNYVCAMCETLLPPQFDLDHIIPLHKGGSNDWKTNLQCLCAQCHNKKSTEEVLALIDSQQMYEIRTIHTERRLPTGERQWLVEWDRYPKRKDWTWEGARNLEDCALWRQWIADHLPAQKKEGKPKSKRRRV